MARGYNPRMKASRQKSRCLGLSRDACLETSTLHNTRLYRHAVLHFSDFVFRVSCYLPNWIMLNLPNASSVLLGAVSAAVEQNIFEHMPGSRSTTYARSCFHGGK